MTSTMRGCYGIFVLGNPACHFTDEWHTVTVCRMLSSSPGTEEGLTMIFSIHMENRKTQLEGMHQGFGPHWALIGQGSVGQPFIIGVLPLFPRAQGLHWTFCPATNKAVLDFKSEDVHKGLT